MSRFNDTLDALWTVLDADAALSALMVNGTKYRFAQGDLIRPLLYEPAWCPILALAPEPAGSKFRPARRRRGSGIGDVFAVRSGGATAGQARAPILNLADTFREALEADLESARSLLAAQGVDEIDFENLACDSWPDEKNTVILSWTFHVTLMIKFRVS